MRTFVVYLRRNPEVLARVVVMLHRRGGQIDSLTAERAETPGVIRMCIRIEADGEQAARLESNLYKLVDVLLIERSDCDERPRVEAAGGIGIEPMKVIYVVTTGGTIEKGYSEPTGSVKSLESKMERYLGRLRLPGTDVRVVPLLNKDSLEMTDSDRVLILGTVRALLAENAPIVITHGTDTLVETGLFVDQAIADLKVPIVLTGAMVPLGFDGSDALRNLTESLFAARILDPGVYIVIHGEMFPVHKVRKDRKARRFVRTDENLG
jgi:L-asparaginase